MQPKKYTEKYKRQRKFLLIAPIGVIVLLTILFSAMGGGKGSDEQKGQTVPGLNTKLPDAHLREEKGLDKFAMYKKAELDSMRRGELLKRQGGSAMKNDTVGGIPVYRMKEDSNVEKVTRKVADLRQQMADPATSTYRSTAYPTLSAPRATALPAADIDRLERMMKVMKGDGQPASPEMRELNSVLDKLMRVQEPRVLRDSSRPGGAIAAVALPVSVAIAGESISGWEKETGKGNRFYDLESSSGGEAPVVTAMEAIIPETQTLVNGAVVRLELATELVIKGEKILVGTPLFGVAHLNNERLQVAIVSIICKGQLYPVNLQVVDQDGLAGIYEPGSMSRDIIKESAGEGLGSIGLTSFDPSIGAQAASAGIQMARSLAGKKVRAVRVVVKQGYRVFLLDLSKAH